MEKLTYKGKTGRLHHAWTAHPVRHHARVWHTAIRYHTLQHHSYQDPFAAAAASFPHAPTIFSMSIVLNPPPVGYRFWQFGLGYLLPEEAWCGPPTPSDGHKFDACFE